MDAGVSLTGGGSSTYLGCLTVGGRLQVTLVTAEPIISKQQGKGLLDGVTRYLQEAVAPSRSE